MACTVADARKAAAQADTAAQMAMVFELNHPQPAEAIKPPNADKIFKAQRRRSDQAGPLQAVQGLWDRLRGQAA